MRILIIHQFYTKPDEPGISRFSLLGKEWRKKGHEITIITGTANYLTGKNEKGGWLWRKENDGGIKVMRVRSFTLGFGYHSTIGRALAYITFLKGSLVAGFFLKKPDIVIASSPPFFLGLTGWAISRIRRVPFVFEVRDLWPDELIELGELKNKVAVKASYALERFLYARARFIVANSPGIKEFLVGEKKLRPERIAVIENPVDISEPELWGKAKEQSRKELGWDRKFVILYSGNHGRVYDFEVILEAAKELKTERPEILFVLIGDGKQKKNIVAQIEKENISNIETFQPIGRSEMGKYVSAADACVVSLKNLRLLRHVYATKVFEYMAYGKPIILAMEGVTRNLVCEKARAGICVAPGSREGIKKAIFFAMENAAETNRLGKNGQVFAAENFTSEDLADKYLSALLFANPPPKQNTAGIS